MSVSAEVMMTIGAGCCSTRTVCSKLAVSPLMVAVRCMDFGWGELWAF